VRDRQTDTQTDGQNVPGTATKNRMSIIDITANPMQVKRCYVAHLPEKDVDQDDNVEYQIKYRERMILQNTHEK